MTFHRVVRNTHLILGLSAMLFVLTYAISAAQMAHRWVVGQQITEIDLPLAAGLEPRPLAQLLMDRHGYDGELGTIRNAPVEYRFVITRAGANYSVTYNRTTGNAHVRAVRSDMLGVLNRLHHFNGLHNQSAARNAWGWALLLVSITLLLLGITGIYMWFRMYNERAVGYVLLGSSLVVSVGLLAMLRA